MEHKFDARWLVILVVMISVITTTFMLNHEHIDDSANKLTGTIDIDNGDQNINWSRYQTIDIDLNESINISESGTYHLVGSLDNGSISIDAGIGEVRLILDNVEIKNTAGPAIACYSAEDLVIELVGNNIIEDGAVYSSNYDEDVSGAIYSKADLTFQGDGGINITSNYQDAIVSKDDLKFNSGSYVITSADDGIRGKDSVYIVNGDFTINSMADAIKSTNELGSGKGFVLIEDGSFNISSEAKGIKAINSILINGGKYDLDTYDDAIHSNNYIGIIDGEIKINSSDDGIHADRELIIDGGKIEIEKAYEGLEAQTVTVNDGDIEINSNDDGINAGGGADSSSKNRQGANPFDVDENCILSINGGKLYINAAGDGLDSNGAFYINGGTIIVDGPTNNGNGALDSGSGIIMNNGEIIAIGASGMAESISQNSQINNLSIYLSSNYPAKTKIEIKDSTGKVILTHTSEKSFNHMIAGSSKLATGEKYAIYINDEEYKSFTIESITTTIGNNDNQQMMPGRR